MGLGADTAVVTSCSPDVALGGVLPGARLQVLPSPESTTFRNEYEGAYRRQHLLARANPLSSEDVPAPWRASSVVLLGPVASELEDDLFSAFPAALLGLTPQGMMRAWDGEGRVYPVRWERAEALLRMVDVLVLSEDDLPSPDELTRYTALVEIVAVTHSERGATVYERGKGRHFPAFPSDPIDPTGAGDTFAAAFLLELERTGSVGRAAQFANCAASFIIESEGISSVPAREKIEQRLAPGPARSS